ncbi:RNA-directed DNA polymerase, eukaryota [Tanacetum coccineum]
MDKIEEEWTTVHRKIQRSKGVNANFTRVMKDKATTFFFTRFPESWDEKALWVMFERYGAVVDVYLATKRTKLVTRFGFVRFLNVNNIGSFELQLKGICIGGIKMIVNIAKYDKHGAKMDSRSNSASYGHHDHEWQWTFKRKEATTGNTNAIPSSNGRSFKDVTLGNKEKMSSPTNQNVDTIIEMNLGNWMSYLSMWEEGIDPTGRLEIEGLPAQAWDSVVVDKIGSGFGSVLEIDNMGLECSIKNSVGVLIHTINMNEISKYTELGQDENEVEDENSVGIPETNFDRNKKDGKPNDGSWEELVSESLVFPHANPVSETKMTSIDSAFVTNLWGSSNFDFLVGGAIGLSGGTLLVWDTSLFTKELVLSGPHFIGVLGKWKRFNEKIAIVNIYGPQVRSREERFGSVFVERDAMAFNNFIASGGLHDFPLGGRRFTRYNKQDGFNNIVESSWRAGIYNGSADIVLKNKLKRLKQDIKEWWKVRSSEINSTKIEIQSRLADWDAKAEAGLLTSDDCIKREEILMDLQHLEQKERLSLKQKSRVKWAVEGDENTKFFHSLVNKKK